MKILIALITLLLVNWGTILGQNPEDKDNIKVKKADKHAFYELEYTFSGQIAPNLDSLYRIHLIIDENELDKMERFYIKMGSGLGLSDLVAVAIDKKTLQKKNYDKNDEKEKLLSRKDKNIKVDLGIHPYADYYLEVHSKNDEDKYLKSINKAEN